MSVEVLWRSQLTAHAQKSLSSAGNISDECFSLIIYWKNWPFAPVPSLGLAAWLRGRDKLTQ